MITGLLFAAAFLLFHFCPISVLLFQKNRALLTLALFSTLELSISLTYVTQLMLIDINVPKVVSHIYFGTDVLPLFVSLDTGHSIGL